MPDQATVPSSNTAGGRPAPTPSGEPLTVKIRCWASQAPRPKTVKHTITIHPDWRVEVPHELDAERRALAFGGWLSCLELESHTIPAARRWLDLTLRNAPPPIRLSASGSWTVSPAQSCCPSTGYDTPWAAFDHARDLNHLCKQTQAPFKQLGDVVRAISAAHALDHAPPIPDDLAEEAAAGGRWTRC